MSEKTASKKKIPLIPLIAVIAVIFVLAGTLLIDFILVSAGVKPIFSSIVSTKINNGEIVVGKGLLYSTTTWRIDTSDGYLIGHKLEFGLFGANSFLDSGASVPSGIKLEYHNKDGSKNDSVNVGSDEEVIELLDDEAPVLNLEAVTNLADGKISAEKFMETYTGVVKGETVKTYTVQLPNSYAVIIEYEGEKVNYMRLYDDIIKEYIDLKTQSIALFLEKRK